MSDSLRTVTTKTDCLFCKIVAGEIPSTKVYEDDKTYAYMDIAPGSDGHLLVVPKVHSADILEIEAEDLSALYLSAQKLARRLIEVLDADGVNVLNNCGSAAWQTVFHTHVHVIPRYAGRDTLQLPWTPVEGDLAAIQELGAKIAF